MELSEEAPRCYNCRVRTSRNVCFKEESMSSSHDFELAREDSFLRRLREPFRSTYMRAMQIKSLVSSTVSDIVNYFTHPADRTDADIASQIKSQLQYAFFPEHVLRCELCHCFFSDVGCRCPACFNSEDSHYVVLMHGVLVSSLMMADIAKALFDRYPAVYVYFAVSASGKTLHGSHCVVNSLVLELGSLFSKLPAKFKLSLIGHSYGGILLRYFVLHYHMTHAQPPSGQRRSERKSRDDPDRPQTIVWKNLFCMATPHAGIYENNVEFRKLISLIGSKTLSELENSTVDLLFLLRENGFLDRVENVAIYGNISGDIMVAPRTSIILPNHVYSEAKLAALQQLLARSAGQPLDIHSDLVVNFLRQETASAKPSRSPSPRSSGSASPAAEPEDEDREALFEEFVAKFESLVRAKISNTKDLPCILNIARTYKRARSRAEPRASSPKRARSERNGTPTSRVSEAAEDPGTPAAAPEPPYLAELFADDLPKFREVVAAIVRRADAKLLRALKASDSFFYNEVLLTLLYRVPASKFAVYIPRIHMPHRSIVTFQSPVVQEHYTEMVLSHLVHTFAM